MFIGQHLLRSVLLLIVVTIAVDATVQAKEPSPSYPPLFKVSLDNPFPDPARSFDEVRQLILEKYYSTSITEGALYHAAIKGMLAHISPPSNREQATLWAPQTYDVIRDSLKGEQVSIGIRSKFDAVDGSLTVTEVLADSPADGKLLLADRIMRINGEALKARDLLDVNEMLNGEPDSSIDLVVVRDIEVLNLSLTRHRFKLENLTVSQLPDGIALIEIHKVDRNISKALAEALQQLQASKAAGVIIDLRNNTGGVFAEGLRMAELFLPAKDIILRTVRNPNQLQNYVSSAEHPFEMKLAVLVNKKTASSAEILASSLQAHGRASLIGTSTYGKATMEETFTLKNNYRVKFIIGAMYDPLGRSWQDKGLTPDYYIHQQTNNLSALAKLKPEQRLKLDQQLVAAWKLLKAES
jgi:carboxyl-terminal processing protease